MTLEIEIDSNHFSRPLRPVTPPPQHGTESATVISAVELLFSSVIVRSLERCQVVMELEAADMDLFQDLCSCLDDMKKANEIERYVAKLGERSKDWDVPRTTVNKHPVLDR